MPEVCRDAALLVDAEDPRAYRAAIDAVLSDPARSAELCSRGRRRASELSWDAAGERLFELVQRLIEEERGPPIVGMQRTAGR